ncbi:hypothetical protein ABB37_09313 [Leptomonas pyrrhocoris]|uniref:Uncharacterized protein n=1 Tax=Leptomonas pyrrhocoris TaxID=157538 RepID=A0A0M9FRE0_LEPPY|nr:hypothetical protein ABB37_09313 [Leptomonas pyrrhocoris]KPA74326.1 hypothetical protein ABB37_09313 [Leptomonas pyrrhocoris]|eukprot:XP_015652765.1 hypothetical protein ABB37_09313 [Leptomonas pyrrhocoris]
MPPSHVRKEEAELRQIAKQSRNARKEAQERERKQRQRAARIASKNGEGDAAASNAEPKKKQRGAIIMPDEVNELRQRLMSGDAGDAHPRSNAAGGGKKKPSAKAAAAADSEKNVDSNGDASAAAAAVASSTSTSSSFLVPTFHQEVHFKKKVFFVDVVLHHVPHQMIDVSETNNRQLVVDTTAFTKKYRLVLPFPDGMQCDAAAGAYDFKQGVLSCKLPIMDGTLPANLEEENEKMVEKMRKQKALRFRVSQDGDLTVRTRQALLAATPAAQAALLEAAKEAKAKKTADPEEAEAKGKKRTRKTDAAAATTEEEEDENVQQPVKASKKEARTAAAVAVPPKEAKPDVFKAEHAKALEAAKAAAAKVHISVREKIKLAKTVYASRQERLQTRSQRKERKDEQRQQSFQRVLEEQKRQLLTRAALQQPPAPRAASKSDGPSKSVRFADE